MSCQVRRCAIVIALTLAGLALSAQAAWATFHLNMVNEVMLASGGGDANVQFVELLDHGGTEEEFTPVFAPYKLVIYGASGNRLGGQELSASGMAAASSNRPYLISTAAADTALGVSGDEVLTVQLPHSAGQACYTAMGETPYSCITWGCISHFVSTSGTGSFHGAVPPNGMSAQRQADDSIQIAAPTPKATNVAGTSPKACPTSGGGGGTTFAGVQIPKQTVTVHKGKAPVSIKCPAKAKGSCSGKVTLKTAKAVTDSKGNKRTITLGTVVFTIGAGKTKTVKVPLTKDGKFVVAHHKSIKAVGTAAAHDGTGKSKTTSGKVTLKRPKKK